MNRRDFIAASVATSAVVGLAPSTVLAAVAGEGATALTRQRFLQLMNSRFRLEAPGAGVSVTLVALQDGPRAKGLDQFSLVFQASGAADLPADLYWMRHRRAGRFPLYLEPASERPTGGRLRATFCLFA